MKQQRKVSNYSKKAWAALSFAVWVITINICVLGLAQAAQKQTVNYDVYAGGFHVVDAKLDVDLKTKNRYDLALEAKTQGFLRNLAPWDGVFRSEGWYDPKHGKARPQKHESITVWKDEHEEKQYYYNKDGSFREYRVKDDENDGSPRPVDEALTDQTTDVLSATLEVMEHVAKEKGCQGTSEVFDGKRRFQMIFRQSKQVTLTSNAYNVYSGPALECTIEVKPVAGDWHKKPRGWMSIQEQGRERGTMPTIWFAAVAPGAPAVPVKIRVKTEYGTLFMHMTGYQGEQKTLKLEE
ncbi:MAG: DUF3108 domain-containing protein [Alphaproteobacteria bacterium]|nr:DUF3108 domain-containing protein [Alphaproteobacteria bacterium]